MCRGLWVIGYFRKTIFWLFISGLCLLPSLNAHGQDEKTVALLPFRIFSSQPLAHLKEGLQEMLASRLSKKGLSVTDLVTVNKHPLVSRSNLQLDDIATIGKDVGSDWVFLGSLTQVGERISIDLQGIDPSGQRAPFSIFVVADHIDQLPDAADKITAKIYDQIIGVIQIESITIEGNVRIESDAILTVLESQSGGSFNPDTLDRDLRTVYRMGYFKDVHVKTEEGVKGKRIIFTVQEKPTIVSIAFHGNDEIKTSKLEEEVGIKPYSILNRNEIRQSINRIKDLYIQKGYYLVRINEKIKELPNNEVSLVYEIKEGNKLYITKIDFIGNTRFDDDDLKDVMETSEKGLLSWFTGSGVLDNKKLEFDVQKVTSFYHNNGYINAKAGAPKIEYGETGITITIDILEGEPYKVNTVQIIGDLIQSEEELLKMTRIPDEEYYNREILRADTIKLRSVYSNEGYAYAEVIPRTQEDDENLQVNITYAISKGEKVRFERINIGGNTVTRDKVIRRELKVVEGDYFSGEGMLRSSQNLNRLGYFENVDIQTKKGSRDDLMVLDIKVEERPTGSFMIGGGYSSFESFIGTFSVSENNFLGRGLKLGADIKLGGKTTEFDISFMEPWFLDRPISARVNVFNFKREYDEYTKDSYGGGITFGFPVGIDDYTRGSTSYDYDDADIKDIDKANASTQVLEMEGRNVTSSITLGIRRNSTNRRFLTTKGSINSLSFEYAGGFLGGDVAFNKYLAESTWYFPLPYDTVFMARGNWGYIQARPEDGVLPIYQKFRIGGINTVRGFDYYDISPKAPNGDSIGGEQMMVYNAEFRFPLVKEQGVIGLVFLDMGNVFEDDEDYDFGNLRKSAGLGVRWYSPLGPLRLEYGWKLDRRSGEDAGNYEFSMGGSF